jgi:DNA-binding response OmpR family regulator
VYTANNLEKAKAMVTEYNIRLAIIDFMLPGCHGKQVARALKEINDKLTIIFLSGHEDIFEAVNDLEFDVYRVFIKPENIGELLSAIRAIFVEEDIHQYLHDTNTKVVNGNVGGQQPFSNNI